MRNDAIICRLALLLVLSIGLALGWEAPQALAEISRSEPTLRDLIGGKAKGDRRKRPSLHLYN